MHVLHVMIGYLFFKINTVQLQVAGVKQFTGPGSTPNLEEIILGRCYDYTEIVNPSVGKKNCSEILEALKMAFVHKDPCSISPSDYELYINLTLHEIPAGKSLFWENNKDLVHRYSDRTKRYMPLGDTLSGWLADNLNWCGTASDPGIEYRSCPTTAECEHNAVESFWRIASVNYAKHSSGEVQIMLNGSTPGGAFPVPSFLADYEIPNFDAEKISKVNIWVMDTIGGGDLDSCGKYSVAVLQNMLIAKHLSHSCIDNYRPVKILQCVDYPSHKDCVTNSGNASRFLWVIMILPWLSLTINPV